MTKVPWWVSIYQWEQGWGKLRELFKVTWASKGKAAFTPREAEPASTPLTITPPPLHLEVFVVDDNMDGSHGFVISNTKI